MPVLQSKRLTGLTFEEAKHLNSMIDVEYPESRIDAVNFLIHEKYKEKKEVADEKTASDILKTARKAELNLGNYLIAATMSWGTRIFDYRPRSVRLIWRALQTKPRLLVYGSGSQGKSYTPIAFKLLDFERDPEFTTIRLCSTTAGHERANTFSNLVRLHRFSAIPFSGKINQGFIGLDKDDRRSSISEVTIDKGDENKSGKLQGIHPLPRPYPHPQFGWETRVALVLDELEDIPIGWAKGEANFMLNLDDEMHVSMVGMWNPKDKTSMAAKKSEPEGGWINLDESVEEYTSKAGYHCIRLDARRSENVVQREKIYIGMQTYEGLKNLEEKGGADYQTFGCGLYPSEKVSFGIVDPRLLEKQRGEYIWSRTPTAGITLDMAEEGEDLAYVTAFRYGLAIAFERESGERVRFDPSRWCIQIDQQFPLEKKNTILMGKDYIDMGHLLHAKAEWSAVDASNTVTLRDWLWLKWGKVLGLKWGGEPTEIPILTEIRESPAELYVNLKTEMFFAAAQWVEFGYMGFAPSMDTAELFAELSDYRYVQATKLKKRCEEGKVYKKRHGGKSPDKAASCVMVAQLVRTRTSQVERPAMDPDVPRPPTGETHVQDDSGPVTVTLEETSDVEAPEWL